MKEIFLSLGGNVGDVQANLAEALDSLEARKVKIINESLIYKTEPVGNIDQDWFMNQVVEVETDLSPQELLYTCLAVEEEMGRIRSTEERWGPRPLDVDILFYGNKVVNTNNLTIPHPELVDRRFVLVPLAEIAPNFVHPTRDEKIKNLLKHLNMKNSAEVLPV